MSRIASINLKFNQRMESFAADFITSTILQLLLPWINSVHSLIKMEFKQRIENFAIRVYNGTNILQLNILLGFTLSIHSFRIVTAVSNNFHKW